jgi:O-acetylhomoserine (thiol)-lyase
MGAGESRRPTVRPISRVDRRRHLRCCETVGNPARNVCDLEALADVVHVPRAVDRRQHGRDPILVRPIEFGADIVIHH